MPITDHKGEKPSPGELTPAMIMDILSSTDCYCGNVKRAFKPLCLDCFNRLPRGNRERLWRRFGQGFEAAYTDSLIFLAENDL